MREVVEQVGIAALTTLEFVAVFAGVGGGIFAYVLILSILLGRG